MFVRIYEVTGNSTFLHTGRGVYDYLWEYGWDFSMTCNGGMYFGAGHSLKNTITNVQMFGLAAKLFR